ncbi:MAG: heavy metal translocating P-type ATPase metal-binding domain-containing protein [Chitinophagaceae bacterium]
MFTKSLAEIAITCDHCGDECIAKNICIDDKRFCCAGCKMVYQLLNQGGLCDYYNLNDKPGFSQRIPVRTGKFAFLDDAAIQAKLISFRDEQQVHVNFYLPQIHCSSCLYLLENLHRLEAGVISCQVNFTRKEASIVFMAQTTSLRNIAELLASIGYEPYISLHDLKQQKPGIEKGMRYRLGIAAFCFGNIMLMSFPEYLGIDASESGLRNIFRWMNAGLSLPVFLYAADPFYKSALKSIRHRFLNIDAPVALAVIITFVRSAWEVLSGTGAGYFDSMTGIVFFMLAGRMLQDKTYRHLSFDRDYTSYFPIAVSVISNNKEIATALPELKAGDTLLIHNEELIPADGIITKGSAYIDYSFVTGESMPVKKDMGELAYAGGKQTGGNIEILVVKEVAQSYLTALWSRDELKAKESGRVSFVHLLSRYFTYIIFGIALLTTWYWKINDPTRIWIAVTAVFIIACPCALLLSNTFTNGSILRILSRNQFFLRSAQTIENIAKTTHIVFDKTGTLTDPRQQEVKYEGKPLTTLQKQQVMALASCSTHPLSRFIVKEFEQTSQLTVAGFKEIAGEGIAGVVEGSLVRIGSCGFITGNTNDTGGTVVYISFENQMHGWLRFDNHYRPAIPSLIKKIKNRYKLSVLTGDNEAEKQKLRRLLGEDAALLFSQKPGSKLDYIKSLQADGEKVMMIGDGLNDAGALRQADTGIALTEGNNNFTPASDAILAASSLSKFSSFIMLCKANQYIVTASFVLSIAYNIIGLYFAVQGKLSPLVAAILMPCSSLCIFLITFGSSHWLARRMKL